MSVKRVTGIGANIGQSAQNRKKIVSKIMHCTVLSRMPSLGSNG